MCMFGLSDEDPLAKKAALALTFDLICNELSYFVNFLNFFLLLLQLTDWSDLTLGIGIYTILINKC